jgi:hypothetical protein
MKIILGASIMEILTITITHIASTTKVAFLPGQTDILASLFRKTSCITKWYRIHAATPECLSSANKGKKSKEILYHYLYLVLEKKGKEWKLIFIHVFSSSISRLNFM